jgi:hypothetical protein
MKSNYSRVAVAASGAVSQAGREIVSFVRIMPRCAARRSPDRRLWLSAPKLAPRLERASANCAASNTPYPAATIFPSDGNANAYAASVLAKGGTAKSVVTYASDEKSGPLNAARHSALQPPQRPHRRSAGSLNH